MTHVNYNNIVISILFLFTLLGIMLTVNYYLDENNNIPTEQNVTIGQSIENKNKSMSNKIVSKSVSVDIIKQDIQVAQSLVSQSNKLLWGAYLGDGSQSLNDFEKLVGKETNFYADFLSWQDKFPLYLLKDVGQKNKTLVIFWEPNFGYDKIIDGSYDKYISNFAKGAKQYSDPVIFVPFAEMNLNEEAWGYGENNNSSDKFVKAWRHVHGMFKDAPNVLFGLAYNNVSIPNIEGNLFADYYPGDAYVDYVGVDGFSFNNNWQDFGQIFDQAIWQLDHYKKPILIFSMAADDNSKKAAWILDGLGKRIKNYENVIGFIWFNQHDDENWLIDSDTYSLKAFRSILL